MREFSLLRHVYQYGTPRSATDIILGPGDDMAVVGLQGQRLVLGVDQLVDRRHIDLRQSDLKLAGRKAVTRCLSDIAAMAARPLASLAAVALPPSFTETQAKTLFNAMHVTADHYQCPLVGGDIAFLPARTDPLVISITAVGTPAGDRVLTRSGAQPGDGVYVTGTIGGAVEEDGRGKHLYFSPRIEEAIALLHQLGDRLHAMIDISDGLGRDAGHIAEMSKVLIELVGDEIPCTPGRSVEQALSDGEDYELCFTAAGQVPESICGIPISRIGTVLDEPPAGMDIDSAPAAAPAVLLRERDHWVRVDQLGWEHASDENETDDG